MGNGTRTDVGVARISASRDWDTLGSNGAGRNEKNRQPFIIALGHPMYYPRFGYIRASCYRITSQYSIVPDEAFMILILDEGAFSNVSGVGMYRAEFDITV